MFDGGDGLPVWLCVDTETRACCNNMRDMMASLVDMPRLYRLGTRIGHDTVNEKHVEEVGISRG